MLTALVTTVYNKNIPMKSIVPDTGWFDGDRTKFEDQWRRIQLFLKSNRVVTADNKITTVLAQLRGGIAGIYVQKKIDKLENTECYDLKSLESDNRTTLVLSNTRKLDRELFYKLVYLYSPTGSPC